MHVHVCLWDIHKWRYSHKPALSLLMVKNSETDSGEQILHWKCYPGSNCILLPSEKTNNTWTTSYRKMSQIPFLIAQSCWNMLHLKETMWRSSTYSLQQINKTETIILLLNGDTERLKKITRVKCQPSQTDEDRSKTEKLTLKLAADFNH